MQPEAQKYLYDILQACEAVKQFLHGKNLDDYNDDLLLQSGIERQLMIIGEALNQAYKADPNLSAQGMLELILDDVIGYVGDKEASDDITIVVIRHGESSY